MSEKDETLAMNYCRQLADFDRKIRRHAMNKLIEIAHPVSIPYLIQSLADEDTLVKTGAENTLIKIGEPSLDKVIESFKNQNSEVRLRAVNVYKSINTNYKLEELVPLIEDGDKSVKDLTILRLEKELNRNASEALWQLVKNPQKSELVRTTSLELLEKNICGISDILLDDFKNNNLDSFAIDAFAKLYLKLNPKGNAEFSSYINSDIENMRILAMISLGEKDQDKLLSYVKTLVYDESHNVRKKAVEMLGIYGTKNELELLNELKNSRTLGVWKVTKEAITKIKEREQ